MLSRLLPTPTQSFFLLGPRGTGKSTWIRERFPTAVFYDLLRADEALRLTKDPGLLRRELAQAKRGTWVAIDEIQKIPSLLDEVHALIEERGLKFILSGSSARKLRRGGANLLAGRARIIHLFPLVSAELGKRFSVTKALQHGLLPASIADDEPAGYLAAYAQTYLREEIFAEALTRNLGGFARFLEIAARQNGQITNASNVARDAQVARQTVQGYFEILSDTLVGFWLEAWKLKRATKQVAHPKFYFFDPGVARALSGRLAYPATPEEEGFLLETTLLHEIRSYLSYRGLRYPMHFWSSHDGVEVDVLIEDARGFVALEIKRATRWEPRFGLGLTRIQKEMKRVRPLGVFQGPRPLMSGGIEVVPVQEFLRRLWDGEWIS